MESSMFEHSVQYFGVCSKTTIWLLCVKCITIDWGQERNLVPPDLIVPTVPKKLYEKNLKNLRNEPPLPACTLHLILWWWKKKQWQSYSLCHHFLMHNMLSIMKNEYHYNVTICKNSKDDPLGNCNFCDPTWKTVN